MGRLTAKKRGERDSICLSGRKEKGQCSAKEFKPAIRFKVLRDKTMPRRIELRSKIREPLETPALEARITLGLTQQQLNILTRLAQAEHRSINHVIRTAIDAMITAAQPESDKLTD